jgi:hypothetical protein
MRQVGDAAMLPVDILKAKFGTVASPFPIRLELWRELPIL